MTPSQTQGWIRERLEQDLTPIHLDVIDESHRHAGHAGARRGGGHFAVTVVSAAFEGLAAPGRHRLVYRALSEQMKLSIHALALATYTPREWQEEAAQRRPPSTLE